MNIEEIRNYCLSKPATEESLPFDEDTLVFKVMGKMFALISITNPDTLNLKCEPEYALELREKYAAIRPGWHMNKIHWNTVQISSGLNKKFISELIDHSYEQVVSKMPKKMQDEILKKSRKATWE
jgi:predicted DNA-binding protein (MmcQ/YjbR family)